MIVKYFNNSPILKEFLTLMFGPDPTKFGKLHLDQTIFKKPNPDPTSFKKPDLDLQPCRWALVETLVTFTKSSSTQGCGSGLRLTRSGSDWRKKAWIRPTRKLDSDPTDDKNCLINQNSLKYSYFIVTWSNR